MKGNLQIHSENILPIIKKWLYSDREIFVRELVSNACDAIRKVQILREQGKIPPSDESYGVHIQIDKDKGTLTFSDNGIGMDADEVQKYIAQIAFSGAEEFVQKYTSQNEKDQFIGHFGLGFYSSYMVADQVDINTLSYKEGAEPVFWSCDGSADYLLEKGSRETRGTDIILHISKDHAEFLDESYVRKVLEQYCKFLPYPIFLGSQRINEKEPLWMKAPQECTKNDYLEFYRHLYPMQEDPLFWVHLNVDYPFHLKGILYFPKLQRHLDLKTSSVKLYCNRVFVSDNCKDLIPEYLMPLRGVIDSPDIPLNVSRSYLQMDRTVRQLASHISKKVADSLSTLYNTERERFIECWEDIAVVVKYGAIEDEKFYNRVKEFLIWKNTDGIWTTVEDYLERNKEKTKQKVLYTTQDKHFTHIIDIYKEKGIEILCAPSMMDPYLIHFLEGKLTPVTFQRVDAGIDENLIDASREKSILDAEGKTEAGKLADFIRSKLSNETVSVEAKSLATDRLPGFISIDENQRRMREYMERMEKSDQPLSFLEKRTFVVNTNSPLINAIQKLDASNPDLAKEMVQEVYDLALLSQREIDAATLSSFVKRTSDILEKLLK